MTSAQLLDRLSAAAKARPSALAVFTDFDGTLSPIVDDPAAASPAPGAIEALVAAAEVFGRVAVISGRPVGFLQEWLPPSIDLFGLYGLESRVDGTVSQHPDVHRWLAPVAAAAEACDAALADASDADRVEVERKGASLTIHFRNAPHLEDEVKRIATAASLAYGLTMRPAKQSVELHADIDVHKGDVVRSLLTGVEAAVFLGDDVGDLTAFDAIGRFAAQGGIGLRVGVVSAETDAEVAAAVDLELPGPESAVRWLRALTLQAAPREPGPPAVQR